MSQLSLFNDEGSKNTQYHPHGNQALKNKFQGAFVFSAVGDALGWPTEFGRYPSSVEIRDRDYPHREFVEWHKRIGGRWWGYDETLKPGSYSDDTQLSLATARCIDDLGQFDPEQFALFELPLWLAYEQGGGRSIKLAARSIMSGNQEWWKNFYYRKSRKTPIDYRNAGANGAAMRMLPISLPSYFDEAQILRDAFLASIPTHGHPRALLGAQIYASVLAYILRNGDVIKKSLTDYIDYIIETSFQPLEEVPVFRKWLNAWNKKPLHGKLFEQLLQDIREEGKNFNSMLKTEKIESDWEYYKFTGADSEPFRGSGLSTVFVALYLLLKYLSDPQRALLVSVNALGSDTDTIANMTCGLLGAYHGTAVIPKDLFSQIQDRDYLISIADRLWSLSRGGIEPRTSSKDFDKDEARLRVFAWEIGLHEMFWDALDLGSRLIHPALGPGEITRKERKEIPRQGYYAKLIEIEFDYGQTCTFHSRISENGKVSSSIANEVRRNLSKSLWDLI